MKSRKAKLPHYDERRAIWRGGDTRTLYTFRDNHTGRISVAGGGVIRKGPECTVRVATREEAEEHWQNPLHPGWKTDDDYLVFGISYFCPMCNKKFRGAGAFASHNKNRHKRID